MSNEYSFYPELPGLFPRGEGSGGCPMFFSLDGEGDLSKVVVTDEMSVKVWDMGLIELIDGSDRGECGLSDIGVWLEHGRFQAKFVGHGARAGVLERVSLACSSQ